MGIINLTPDSFYAGSRKQTEHEILETSAKMLKEGADILDLGAYSSRPNAENISAEEEWNRMQDILPKLSTEFPEAIISVDTFRASVAEKAIHNGADIINDISGGTLDSEMFALVAKLNCPYIMMHIKGTPQTMQSLAQQDDLGKEVIEFFEVRIKQLHQYNFNK